MANPEHLKWLQEGVEAWNARRESHDFQPDLSGANFLRADFCGANLSRSIIREADFSRADLRGANLNNADLSKSILVETNFSEGDLNYAIMSLADLHGAILREAKLSGAILKEADLSEADFNKAYLSAADVRSTSSGITDLRNATGLIQNQLETMLGDTGVLLPEGLHHPAHWPKWEGGKSTAPTQDAQSEVPPKQLQSDPLQPFVFLSYANADSAKIANLRDALQAEGIPIWWDQDIQSGDDWRDKIPQRLSLAAVILTVWTERSVQSQAVIEEANAAKAEHKLVHVRLDDAKLPDGFDETQYVDMRGWSGDINDPRFQALVQLLLKLLDILISSSPVIDDRKDEHRPLQRDQSAKDDHLSMQRDQPAKTDLLGREPFARVIANRLREAWKSQSQSSATSDDRAFFLHLDGPWGSGKSSVINFVKNKLQNPDDKKDERWTVVDFNAWREERIQPPWWALIYQLVRQVSETLNGWEKWKFRAIWFGWKIWNNWAAYLLVLGCCALVLWLFLPGGPLAVTNGKDDCWDTVKGILGIIGGLSALVLSARTVVFGSHTTALAMEKLCDDPYGPVMALFKRLVACTKRPILIVIDDIDRCSAEYVVTLLENIQTMFRREPVSYLIAGDRQWVVTSFEKHYQDFSDAMARPGQQSGYVFLQKIFQLSVTIPRVDREQQNAYWQHLLASSSEPVADEAVREEAQKRLQDKNTVEDLQHAIDAAADNASLQQAIKAEAAVKVASVGAEPILEHRYKDYFRLLEPNPRAMKRLINAIGINQSVRFIEGSKVDPDLLALWTVLEMRWPVLTEQLKTHRDWLPADGDPPAGAGPVRQLLYDADVRNVLNGVDGKTKIDRAGLDALFPDNAAPESAPRPDA